MRRRSFTKLSNDSLVYCLRNFSLCLAIRLFFLPSYAGFAFVKHFYWVSFFSLFPLERLVDFLALWTYQSSEPTGFFFCFEFAVGLSNTKPTWLRKRLNSWYKSWLSQSICRWSSGVWDIVWDEIGFRMASLMRGFIRFCVPFWHHAYNILKPCCLLHTSHEHVIHVYTAGQYRPNTLHMPGWNLKGK